MKKITIISLIMFSISVYAQKVKQYEIKSGKIVYQHLKYYQTTKTITDSDGNTTNKRIDTFYVEKEVNYYWDNYGDVWLEEAFKVSEFGGKALPEKIKTHESLYKDGHRYYYKFDEYNFADDFIGNRGKWRKNPDLVKKEGWYKVSNPDAKVTGKEKICGKEATIYDKEAWVWKGLILKDVSYYTTPKGEIKGIARIKEAIKVEGDVKFDKDKFNPTWLQQELVFKKLNYNRIDSLIINKQCTLLDQNTKIKQGEKLVYKTTEGNLGKIVITEIDEEDKDLKFIYMTYHVEYGVCSTGHNYGRPLSIDNDKSMDMDKEVFVNKETTEQDVKIDFSIPAKLLSLNNTKIYKLK